jgi:hypothetical protein
VSHNRSRTWLIEGQDGDCRVLRNRSELATGLTEAEALRFIRRKIFRGDKVFRVADDGYRTPLKAI